MTAPAIPTLAFNLTEDEAPAAVTVTVTAPDADSVTVDWGDGSTTDTSTPGEFTHTFLVPGQWSVSVTGTNTDGTSTAATQAVSVWMPDGVLPVGPCQAWITEADVDCEQSNQTLAAIDAATRWFFDQTCGVWTGTCTALIRPLTGDIDICEPRHRRGHHRRRLDMSRWLPAPITKILEVRVNSQLVSREWWKLDNYRYLTALDGFSTVERSPLYPWPAQFPRQLGAPGTWSILVEYGRPVPDPLKIVTARFACEILRFLAGSDKCELPSNAVSVTRDGVQVQLKVQADGKTGVPFIDSALDLYGCKNIGLPGKRIHDPMAPRADVAYLLTS